MKTFLTILASLIFTTAGPFAFAGEPLPAQDTPQTPDSERTIRDSNRTGTLPPSQSDSDLKPPVPGLEAPRSGLVEQAGIGGVVSYARTGVLELGGSVSLAAADGYIRFSLAPSIGYFIIDNIQISAMLGVAYTSIDTPAGTSSQTTFSAIVEPSVHIPFTKSLFGFLGVGFGVAYADSSGAGFALQPRLGLNVMVGRSGILSPAIYVQYTTTSAIQTAEGTLLQVSFGYGVNVGYTVMW